jgi:hypothetical protein
MSITNCCDRCGKGIKLITKTNEFLDAQGRKLVIRNIPYNNCDCYGDTIGMRDLAMIEYYISMEEKEKEIDFSQLAQKYSNKSTRDLIDPEGILPIDSL